MVFSSLIFLWLFLPLVLLGYYIVPKKAKNMFLLLASLLFYTWGEPIYILLMLFSIVVNWALGLVMWQKPKYKKVVLVIDILVNVGILGYFKYFNFLIDIVNNCFHTQFMNKEISLPIGISFFTFQIMSYMIDLYRGEYKVQKNLCNLALYISFFPQLIAGPIVKYKDINEQLSNRVCSTVKTAEGIRRFIYGLGKKVIIANCLAKVVDTIYGLEYAKLSGGMAWIAAIFYTLQIYYDFSGYSDMAIGLGRIFGFEFQENFLYPYLSGSIQEFWNRWHISLGTWFKEYLYIPLGGNRKGKYRTYINLCIVFFVTGLWHGASVNFILWGLFHGIFSIFERLGLKKILSKNVIVSRVYTLFVVNLGWVLFRAKDLQEAGIFMKHMLFPWRYVSTEVCWQRIIGNETIFIAILAVIGSGVLQACVGNTKLADRWKDSYVEMVYCMLILILSIAMLASNTYNPFIYFRF